jgi:hypothetical protein
MRKLWSGLGLRWRTRNLTLVCPHCKRPPEPSVFGRVRYLPGDEKLTCQHCSQTSFVTLWRFEGASHRETRQQPLDDDVLTTVPSCAEQVNEGIPAR